MKTFIGLDNGASGSLGIIHDDETYFMPVPTKHEQDYTKKDKKLGRLDALKLKTILWPFREKGPIKALIERPFMSPIISVDVLTKEAIMKAIDDLGQILTSADDVILLIKNLKPAKVPTVDLKFFKTSLNSHRFYEATILLMDSLQIGYETVDSKAWQKHFLGAIKGSAKLKNASKSKGMKMYPELAEAIKKHGDADGLFIAMYSRLYWDGK